MHIERADGRNVQHGAFHDMAVPAANHQIRLPCLNPLHRFRCVNIAAQLHWDGKALGDFGERCNSISVHAARRERAPTPENTSPGDEIPKFIMHQVFDDSFFGKNFIGKNDRYLMS